MCIRAGKKIKTEVSLSEPLGTDKDGNEISFNDILGTDSDAILEDLSSKLQISRLYAAVASCLSQRERLIIVKRYGLDGTDPLTQREVAALLNISRSYISRIEKKAVAKLRENLSDIR